MAEINRLLVTRLENLWDPFRVLDLEPQDVADLSNVEPITEYAKEVHARSKDYHRGRIRHFLDRLKLGEELNPIEVDNECNGGHIYAIPVLEDGNHRLCAYILAGREVISAYYGGRMDLLEYLEGERDTLPE